MKITTILAISLFLTLSACANTTVIGNLQNDCVPGLLSPSVCLVTATVQDKTTAQYPVSGPGLLGIVVPAAAQVGGAALIGNGLSKSGTNVSNTSTNNMKGATAAGGSSSANSDASSLSNSSANSNADAQSHAQNSASLNNSNTLSNDNANQNSSSLSNVISTPAPTVIDNSHVNIHDR